MTETAANLNEAKYDKEAKKEQLREARNSGNGEGMTGRKLAVLVASSAAGSIASTTATKFIQNGLPEPSGKIESRIFQIGSKLIGGVVGAAVSTKFKSDASSILDMVFGIIGKE